MLPKTRLRVSKEEAETIRENLRATGGIEVSFGTYLLAEPEDTTDIVELLKDDRVSEPVYSLPRPVNQATISKWITHHTVELQNGEGALMILRGDDGIIGSLVDFQFWPELTSCEFSGVFSHDLQSKSHGCTGAQHLCRWAFEVIGIKLIAMAAAHENIRTQKLLDRLGFKPMGECECIQFDGSIRSSLYWEMQVHQMPRQAKIL